MGFGGILYKEPLGNVIVNRGCSGTGRPKSKNLCLYAKTTDNGKDMGIVISSERKPYEVEFQGGVVDALNLEGIKPEEWFEFSYATHLGGSQKKNSKNYKKVENPVNWMKKNCNMDSIPIEFIVAPSPKEFRELIGE